MRAVTLVVSVVGASLAACSLPISSAEAAEGSPDPGVRLLSLRVFWADPPGHEAGEGASAASETRDRNEGLTGERPSALEVLTLDEGDARAPRPGSALLVARAAGSGSGRRSVSPPPSEWTPVMDTDLPAVIGTRTRSRHGTVHTLNVARLAALADPARETIRDLIGLRAMERRAYWEAAFELTGLRRDEIDWVEAVGPGLIKPSRKWATLLREAIEQPAPAGGPEGRSCLGLGPLSLCLNLSRMALSLAGVSHPRERSRVRLTRSLWDRGTSCGAVVSGRLLDYTTVTFRVRTNGHGTRRAGVTYLPPFDFNGALGHARGADAVEPEPR